MKQPGVYEYQEGMTLRDVVLQAGGFSDDAYTLEAEISRIVEETGTGATKTDVRVPIDSTYVVTRARAEHFQEGLDGEAGTAPTSSSPDMTTSSSAESPAGSCSAT